MKKSIFWVILLIAVMLPLAACNNNEVPDGADEDPDTGVFAFTVEDMTFTDEDAPGSLVDIGLLVFDNVQDEALANINEEIAELTTAWAEGRLEQDAMEYANDPTAVYEHSAHWDLTFGNAELVSVKADIYENREGAAHPTTVVMAYSFDRPSGQMISLGDLLGADYSAILTDAIITSIETSGETEMYYPDYKDYIAGSLENPIWYADDENIHVFFAPSDIAPHAAGIREFIIQYK